MSATDSAKQTTSEITEFVKAQSPELKEKIESAERLMESSWVKFGSSLVQDQGYMGALEKIVESKQGTTLLAYEVGLILLLWIFRAWRLSKVNTLFARLLTQAWIGVLYWVLALLAVPMAVFGEAYWTLVSHSVRALLRQVLY